MLAPELRHSTEVTELDSKDRSTIPIGPTMNTSTNVHHTEVTETGNYDFSASLSVQKNSNDSLLQASLF